MDSLFPGDKSQLVSMEIGKKYNLGFNRLVRFEITTSGGSIISGFIPANEYLEVTNGGDITSADINSHDIQKGPQEV